ncbi:type IVB secretion system protein IcmH/DotU [Colwellia sp. MSW7]|uniref:Type IVB secretion system protein IcmH/DotU n=1 Tax=Colwellia maritima TaxID=2912588 RepID=A0ABS9WZM4_9GAMM|nr:type IVB secretion system protein IcmH/DotU [Colwellia maritima]
MNNDDLSKTLIIPNPGGRRKPSNTAVSPSIPSNPEPVVPQAPQPRITPNQFDFNESISKGENVILSYASNILMLANNLRSLEPNNSIEQLRLDIEKLVTKFDQQMQDSGLNKEVVLTARYLICCLVDELVLSTPWGSDSVWSHQTLLGKFHNETSGGEKFFLIVNKLLEQPQRNIDLIELCYVCISTGFCGKYRVVNQGEGELLQISQKLYQPIEKYRPIDRDLSPNWQGIGKSEKSFGRRLPTLFVYILFGFVLIALYIGLLTSLKTKVEPLYQKIESVGWNDFVLQINENRPKSIDVNAIADSLKLTLKKSVDDKVVAIDVRDNMLIIRLISTDLFKSGSSHVNEDALPDVNLLVNSIKDYADRVLVIGHTDSTGKADSNWVISRKRAEAIAKWLEKSNNKLTNIVTRGVADTEPFVKDTDNDYNQSLNRRVELILVLKGL